MTWPTSSAPVAGTGITAAGITAIRADLLSTNVYVLKTANESVTSSATIQNDDQLAYALPATGSFIIDLWVLASSAANAAGDLKVGFTFPTGTLYYFGRGADPSIASGAIASVDQTGFSGVVSSGTVLANYGLSTTAMALHLHCLFIATATGTFQFQWAQQTSSGSASTVLAGSHMQVRQVA